MASQKEQFRRLKIYCENVLSTFKDHRVSIYHWLNLPTTIGTKQQSAWHYKNLYMVENVDRPFIEMRWVSKGILDPT